MDNSSSEEDNCTRGFKKQGLGGLNLNRDPEDGGGNKFSFSLANRRSVLDDDAEDEPMEPTQNYSEQPGIKMGLVKKRILGDDSSDEELGRCDSDFPSSERSFSEVPKMNTDTIKAKSLIVCNQKAF